MYLSTYFMGNKPVLRSRTYYAAPAPDLSTLAAPVQSLAPAPDLSTLAAPVQSLAPSAAAATPVY